MNGCGEIAKLIARHSDGNTIEGYWEMAHKEDLGLKPKKVIFFHRIHGTDLGIMRLSMQRVDKL